MFACQRLGMQANAREVLLSRFRVNNEFPIGAIVPFILLGSQCEGIS